MTRTPFRQADVERAIRSAQAAGLKIGLVEVVVDGVTIRVIGERSECSNQKNPWDEVLSDDQDQKIRP